MIFNYVVRRILQSIPILFIVLTMVFVIVRILPGDPAVAALGDYASKEAVTALREKMGLNAPIWIQYLRFLRDLCQGNLGKSMITGYPVAAQLMKVVPYSLELTFSAILFGFLFGISLGIPAAVRRNSFMDYFNRVFSLMGLSIPAFYLPCLTCVSIRPGLRELTDRSMRPPRHRLQISAPKFARSFPPH